MAAPRLRLRRGTDNPVDLTGVGEVFESGSATQALVGEPLFVDTNGTVPTSEGNGGGDFYIADGGSSFVHIGGSSYTARVDSFLVDQTSAGAGAQIIFEEGGAIANAETITIKAPDDGNSANSYSMILPVGAPTTAGTYVLEYDQATSQLSFESQVASEQLTTQQVPEDTGAANDYFLTFVADNNPNGSGELETFYTEENVVLYPDKDGSGGGTISSLQITGEYVASTGYFSGTGSTDTTSVTTNFATEPTASGNTKAVNVGTGAASGSTTNVNIGSVEGGTTTINSGTVVGAATTQNVFNSVATTVNAFGAATTLELGAATGTTNINNNLDVDGDVLIDGGDLNVSTTTFNLANTNATTVNFAGAATTIEIGAATGTTNVNNNLDVDGDVNIDGGDLTVSTTTFNLANTNATTLNIGGAATAIDIGATTGTTSVNNNLDVDGDANIDGGDLTTNQTTFNIINTNATTVNAFGAATTVEIGFAGASTTNINGTTANTLGTLDGALVVDGGASVAGNTTIGGDLAVEGGDIVADPDNLGNTARLFNDSTGTVNVANAATTVDEYSAATSLDIGYNGTATSTTSIAAGAAATGNTKTVNIGTGAGEGTTNINIGTGGAANSTTNVTFGTTTDPDSTTVTINGNLTVLGAQTTTNINTTNTNVQDALLALNSGMGTGAGALANNTNDVGLFIERGTAENNSFVGYDESADFFVMAYIDSAKTAAGSVTFEGAIVSGDAAETPLDFLPLQIGQLRFSDSTSRRGDGLSAESAQVDDVVIGHLTAAAANTEFSVSDATAGRHVYNVVIDGGSF